MGLHIHAGPPWVMKLEGASQLPREGVGHSAVSDLGGNARGQVQRLCVQVS